MGTPAWQLRESQRQKFVEESLRKIFNRTESYREGREIESMLGIALLTDLHQATFPTLTLVTSGQRHEGRLIELTGQIRLEVNGWIDGFARIDQEARIVKYVLAQRLIDSLESNLRSELTKAELDTETELVIYGNHRRTDEVEL